MVYETIKLQIYAMNFKCKKKKNVYKLLIYIYKYIITLFYKSLLLFFFF